MKKLQADAIQKGVYRGTEEERARQNEAQKRSRIIQAESFLDAPIITLSNEWNNPLVGKIVSIYTDKGSPLYTIHDYISNTERCTLVTPFEFSMQKLQMIGKLNPDEICCLFYEGRSHHGTFRKHKTYGKFNDFAFTHYDDWMEKLTQNGFFDTFGDFLKSEEKKSDDHWQSLLENLGPC